MYNSPQRVGVHFPVFMIGCLWGQVRRQTELLIIHVGINVHQPLAACTVYQNELQLESRHRTLGTFAYRPVLTRTSSGRTSLSGDRRMSVLP